MADEIIIRFSVKDDGTPQIEKLNQTLGKTKEVSKSLAPGLESARKSITGFVSENAALTAVLVGTAVALKKAFDESQRYAGEVRDLALASGTTATEASKLLQVLDDYQISSADVTTAMRAMKEKGLVPTIDTLAQLADQYQAITDPAKKLEFAQDNLGRSSSKFLNVLNQSSDALRQNADAVNKNLILTDEQIAKSEKARLAVDAWSDAWMGLKVSAGSAIGDMILSQQEQTQAMEKAIDTNGDLGTWQNRVNASLIIMRDKNIAAADAAAAHGDALDGKLIPALEKTAEVVNTIDYGNIISQAMQLTDLNADYAKTQEATAQELQDLRAQKQELYPWEIEKAEELQGKIDDLSMKYAENADEHKARTDRILADMTLEKIAMLDGVAGFSEAEYEKGIAVSLTMGTVEAASLRETLAMDAVSTSIANGTLQVEDFQKAMDLLQSKTITLTVNQVENIIRADNMAEQQDNRASHESGGSYLIPMSVGREGFDMGMAGTASGGETVNIGTPQGQDNSALIAAIQANKTDWKKAAIVFRDTIAQSGR